MPQLSGVFLDEEEFEKLKKVMKEQGYPSLYAVVKDAVLQAIKENKHKDGN